MKEAAMIFDIGTGSTRVALVTRTLEILAMKSFKNTYYADLSYADAKYFLPAEWQQKLFSISKELLKEANGYTIKYISASAARESIVLLDEAGCAYYGLPNIDNRGKQGLQEISHRAYIEKYTGRPLTEDFSASKLHGLKQKSALYQRLTKILSLSDWIGHLFSKKIVMEYSQACETQLFNIYTKKWDLTLCEAFGLAPEILPEISATGSRYPIAPEIQEELQLPATCVYVVGGADTQLAAQGMDLCEEDIGLVSGTSSPVVKYKNEPPNYEQHQEFNFWCSCDLGGKGYQIETNPGVTGLNLQMALEQLLPGVSYESIDRYIQENTHDLRCLASFTTQSPYKNVDFSNGGFLTKVPFPFELSRQAMIHGIVADIAFAIVFKIRQNEVLSQTNSPYIVGAGGGLRMKSLCQMIADLTGKKLILKENFNEASVIGAARICFSNENTHVPIQKEYRPTSNPYLREKLEDWLLYREKNNSKKEIGAF